MMHEILKILFPSPCLSCGFLSEPLCGRCLGLLEFSPHIREIDGLKVCCGMYFQADSILERLIHPFKYKHHAEIFRLFVPHMREGLRLLKEPVDLILVPVPLFKARQKERGYNQAELLARWVAKGLGCRVFDVLGRAKDTGKQAKVALKAERRENMTGAFELRGSLPRDGQIVLVDDIVTTGSTLLACREVLEAAGYTNISALTLADREKNPDCPWN